MNNLSFISNGCKFTKKSFFLAFVILLILFCSVVTRNPDIAVLNIYFIVYLLIGTLQAPKADEINLTAQREADKIKQGNNFLVNVALVIINNGGKRLCLELSDPLTKDMKMTQGNTELCASAGSGEKIELSYSFSSFRGRYYWRNTCIQVTDPLGCTVISVFVNAEAEVHIQPQYKKFRSVQIRPWRTLPSSGNIPGRTCGNGTDFRGIRDYHPGDPLKALDWRLTAKYPHRFFTKEFEEEKSADILLLIDARQKMQYSEKDKNLLEIEIVNIAALSDMFLHQGYRVGLTVACDKSLDVLPGYGKKQLNKILNSLSRVKPVEGSGDFELESLSVKKQSSKAVIFIFSPFNYNDIYFYRRLRSYGFQVVLICPDLFRYMEVEKKQNPPDDIDIMALRFAKLERKINLGKLAQLSILVIDWDVQESLRPLIQQVFLKHTQIRRY